MNYIKIFCSRWKLFLLLISLLTIASVSVYLAVEKQTPISLVKDVDKYRFINKPCWFEVPWREDIRCGELHTAESTGGFVLPVVIIREKAIDRQPDAVMYLQGGPGGSARLDEEGIKYWLSWRSNTALGRDLILLDPRGVGRSKPSLDCKAYDEFSLSVLKRNTKLQDELAEGYEILQRCFEQLERTSEGFRIEHYGTYMHALDVQELMQLLHYKQWNLVGVSYGTRVALTVANQSPLVRSLILDSVYPVGRGGVQSFPEVLDRAFSNFFDWCTVNSECKSIRKNSKEDLLLALSQLKQNPISLTIRRFNGDLPVNLIVNDHRFISAVFSALYSKHAWQKIPVAINAALTNDAAGVASLMEPFINNALNDDFSSLVFMAVDCRDHPIKSEVDYQQELEKFPLFADYTRDLWRYQSCQFLRTDETSAIYEQKLPMPPALILAGELDPITPVEWARDLHSQWPGSQLLTLKDVGHAVINDDDCIYQSLRAFLDSPQKPVKSCVRK